MLTGIEEIRARKTCDWYRQAWWCRVVRVAESHANDGDAETSGWSKVDGGTGSAETRSAQ